MLNLGCFKCSAFTPQTSMHNTFGMHVIQCTADLNKVFPNCLLWNQATLLLKML